MFFVMSGGSPNTIFKKKIEFSGNFFMVWDLKG